MWYHVRREYLGKAPIIQPKVPEAVSENVTCGAEEGNIPRICVSDNIFKCFRGIMGIEIPRTIDFSTRFEENPYLYITDETALVPPNCLDFRYNNEHWFIKPTRFYYIGRIDMYKMVSRNILDITEDVKAKYIKKDIEFYLDNMHSNVLRYLIERKSK